MCTVTVHPSLVESILEKGLSNTKRLLVLSACQLQAVEHVFPTVMAFVVNSGLYRLGLEAPPPPKIKKSFLGGFNYLNNRKHIARKMKRKMV